MMKLSLKNKQQKFGGQVKNFCANSQYIVNGAKHPSTLPFPHALVLASDSNTLRKEEFKPLQNRPTALLKKVF